MKELMLLILSVCVCVCVCAQNLVPNFSFEQYDTCPNNQGQISYSAGWFQPCKTWNSSDYYNQCDSTQNMGVPVNTFGYQYAMNGNAYAGIVVYNNINYYREFIEIKLVSSLIQNKNYCVSFFASLAELSGSAVNTLGCLLTIDTFLTDSARQEIFLIPQIENTDSIITDTMNWVLILGEFVANGEEHFLTIGNFRNDSNTSVVVNPGGISSSSIYYIDDISVTLCDSDTVGVEALAGSSGRRRLAVRPNPAGDEATVFATGGDEIVITDILGRKTGEYEISTNQLKISTGEFADGVYFIALYNGKEFVAAEKFVVAK